MNKLKHISLVGGICLLLSLLSCNENKETKITIIETTDLHGVIFPYDFIEDEPLNASLAHASTYISGLRENGEAVVLLDNGDNLQGQPTVYYYNFIDTISRHISADVMNYLGYDAGTTGNHDFEAGHSVYDRLEEQYDFPLLSANAVHEDTGEPYFNAYEIIEKNGIKIAVLGLVTASIPEWLPYELYSGIEFRDMVETAKKWMPVIRKEKPDLIVGLFHSGWNKEEFDERREAFLHEDGSAAVAYHVPGFDIIFNGHDHRLANEKFVNIEGDTVLMLNGGNRARNLAQAEVTIARDGSKKISGRIIDVERYDPDDRFIQEFRDESDKIMDYVSREIGTSETTLSSRDSYFGPSPFIDMIHSVQLDITGADISFTAPLSFDVRIPAGPIIVGDMFKLYRYENMLYTMELSGEEIIKYLEYSYGGWLNTMSNRNDYMLRLRTGRNGRPVLTDGRAWLQNQPYDFDSAAGIDYSVDISKEEGERINVKSLTGGAPFDRNKVYRVAINSYRGSGGGGHLTEGAGIDPSGLASRVISSTDKDLRFYIMKYIESKETISPATFSNWKIIPEDWIMNAKGREYRLLFGDQSN